MISKIGSYMVVFGLLSIVLGFFNYVPRLLMWMYNWGEPVAWAIKTGLVLVGGVLYVLGGRNNNS